MSSRNTVSSCLSLQICYYTCTSFLFMHFSLFLIFTRRYINILSRFLLLFLFFLYYHINISIAVHETQDQQMMDEMRQHGIPLSVMSTIAEIQSLDVVDKVLENECLRKTSGIQPKFPHLVNSFEERSATSSLGHLSRPPQPLTLKALIQSDPVCNLILGTWFI
ncbi:unnamed protein product [Musa textilis]